MPIYCDNRGKGELEVAELLKMKKIPVEVKYLESGDFYFNDIGIERKTVNDLIFSTIGKERHLWDQLKVMKDTYKKCLIIVEGYINWKDRLVSGILQGIIIGWQVPYINTVNQYETAEVLAKLFDKYGTSKVNDIPPPAVRKGKTPKQIKWCMLQCVSGIGPKGATEVLKELPDFANGAYEDVWVKEVLRKIKIPSKSKDLLYKVMCE
jgi:ERCC4-type nuclease